MLVEWGMRRGGGGVAAASPLTNPHIPTPNQPPSFNLTPHFSRPLEPHPLPPFLLHTPAPLIVVSALSFTRQPALPPPRPCYLPPTLAAMGGERQGRGWFSAGRVLCWRGSLLAGFSAGEVLCWRGSLLAGFSAGEVLCWRGSLLAGFSSGGVLVLAASAGAGSWCWRLALVLVPGAGG
ncbi:unnamed protein product [Closterium sp. NIES-64]|nr:unnamed protein product [Closterium sp. NIES-64]